MPLPSVITSGTTPACSCANSRPVRPQPVCTSSRISSSPCASHSARSPRRKPGSAGITPASPWIGSSITATVASPIARRTESRSFNLAFGKPGTCGANSVSQPGLPLADIVARVRPWNASTKVTISCAPPLWRRPHLRASLIAPSFASAPELAKNTRSSGPCRVSSAASRSAGALWKAGLGLISVAACAASASATAGGACPSAFTAQPCTQSR